MLRKAFKLWMKEKNFQINQRNADIYKKKKSFKRF